MQRSNIFLAMAGTASEQAVGLGKLVLQLKGHGPQFTPSFAEAQRRLLGPAVFCAEGKTGSELNLLNTANLIIDLLKKSVNDHEFKKQCKKQAELRLGNQGGGQRIAEEITRLLILSKEKTLN